MRMRSDQLGVETGNADDGLQVLWALSAVWAAYTDRPWGVANGAQAIPSQTKHMLSTRRPVG